MPSVCLACLVHGTTLLSTIFIIVIKVVSVIIAVVVTVAVFIAIVIIVGCNGKRANHCWEEGGRLAGRMGMRDGSDGTKEATFFRGHTKVASIELSIVVRDLSISEKV